MGLNNLTDLEIIFGFFTLTFVLISILLGLKILTKYFSLKRPELISVGLTWIFLSSVWWGGTLSFLIIIFFGSPLNSTIYLIIAHVFTPVACLCWIYSIGKILYPHLRIKLLLIFLAFCSLFLVYLFFFLFTDPEVLGTFKGAFYFEPNIYILIFLLFVVFTFLVTGLIFAKRLLQSKDPMLRLKGKFLVIAFIIFTIGTIIEGLFPLNLLTLVLARLCLSLSAIQYYLGFMLPDRVAKWFKKEG